MKAAIAAALVLVALAPGRASAEPSQPLQLGVTGGFRAGGGAEVSEARLFAGYTFYFAATRRRALFLAPGLSLASGSVGFDDPRGVDGRLSASRTSYGPELRAGLAIGPDRWPGAYLYLGAALVHIDAGTDSRELAEAGGAPGAQLTLGVAAPVIQMDAFDGSDDDDGDDELGALAFFLPNTFEITLEQVRGDDGLRLRAGLALGYSL